MADRNGVAVLDLEDGLLHMKRRFRGHTYEIRELSFVEYEKTRKRATTTEPDPSNPGETIDKFDPAYHTAILFAKCVRMDGSPVTADQLYERGGRLVRQLQVDIAKLNFDEETEDEEADEDDEGEAPTNTASSSATVSSPA